MFFVSYLDFQNHLAAAKWLWPLQLILGRLADMTLWIYARNNQEDHFIFLYCSQYI